MYLLNIFRMHRLKYMSNSKRKKKNMLSAIENVIKRRIVISLFIIIISENINNKN